VAPTSGAEEIVERAYTTTNFPFVKKHGGVVKSCDPLQNFGGSNHITGTAKPKVVKICTRVGYINSSNMMTYRPQKGRAYGHVTVLKFCRLP